MTGRSRRQHDRVESAVAPRARGIDRDDHALLNFAISWMPYGGAPSDETLVRFGLTRERYLARLRRTVDEHRRRIHPATVARLMEICGAPHSAGHADGR